MADFKPPSLDSHQGPAGGFVPPPPVEDKQSPAGDPISRSAGAFWEGIGGKMLMDLMGGASRDPALAQKASDTAKDLFVGISRIPSKVWEELSSSGGAMTRGDIPGAAYHLAGAVPVVGPAAQQVADELGAGKTAEAIGHGAALLAPAVAPELAAKMKGVPAAIARKALPNMNNPVEEAALASVEGDVPMSVGQRTGNVGLQRGEQMLENFPGSMGRKARFDAAQEEALATKAQDLADQAGGQRTNAVGAGQATFQKLGSRLSNLRGQAQKYYRRADTQAAANSQQMQVGTKTSPFVDPSTGSPIETPIMKTFESPVDLDQYRAGFTPLYEDLMERMPIDRQQRSPAFAVLKSIVTSDQPYMSAMDFDKSLGAIKTLAREGDNPYVTSKSQGIAKQLVAKGESQLSQSLPPEAMDSLMSARKLWAEYHRTGELMADLGDNPAQLYSGLVTGGDMAYPTLQQLKRVAPAELKTVSRTFLQGLVDKATQEGGFGRSQGVLADWRRIGPESKQLLFGNQLSGDLDNFLLAAKRLTSDKNPSGSGHLIAILHGLGTIGTGLAAFFTGHPGIAVGAAVEGMAGQVVGPNLAAKFLLNADNAKLLSRALQVPPNSPEFSKLAATLNARYAAMNSDDQQH